MGGQRKMQLAAYFVRFAVLLALLILPLPLAAGGGPNPADIISDIECEANPGELTQAVYNCIRETLDRMSRDMVVQVFNQLSNAVIAVLTLAIVFFAFKFILYGTRQPAPEFIAMMLKFTVIATLLFGIRTNGGILEFRELILYSGSGFQNLVFAGDSVFGVDGRNIFEQMDNMLFRFYGVENPQNVTMDKDLAGFSMMGGLLFAGPAGAKALAEGAGVIALLVGAFMMALYINIVALIALTFLLTISPVFLPLFLFKQTERMFGKWRGQIISYSLQPMILTAFLSMMLIVLSNVAGTYDQMIAAAKEMSNSPDGGVQTLRSFASTDISFVDPNNPRLADPNYVDPNDPNPDPNKPKPGLSPNQNAGGGVPTGDSTIGGTAFAGMPALEPKQQLSMGVSALKGEFFVTPFNQNQLSQLGSQMVLLLIVCAIMFRFLKELPGWVSELAGGDRTVPNLATSRPVRQVETSFEKKT